MAFIRYFPGQEALAGGLSDASYDVQEREVSDRVRSEVRSFTRLTPLASWRSEYLLRTRLLRSVARGKPGANSGSIGSASRAGKKSTAVLTYNSKLVWTITHLHAVFSSGKKTPRVIHGSSNFCIGTVSDPTSGKVERWGMDDSFAFAQLGEVFPQLQLYGLGEGPAAAPNVMDVSQPYGMVGGEGFPGGRAFWRSAAGPRGGYLDAQGNAAAENHPDIPKIPELVEGVSSIWIAKSSAVPSVTHSMVGIMTGSTLGVVTTYALGHDASGPRYANGELTSRWVLSPGVPIVALEVDEAYTVRRRSLGRIWAVALNALGEVFYLRDTPSPTTAPGKSESAANAAWYAGRTAHWELVELTRRAARADELDVNAVRGSYSPRSSSNALHLSKEQLAAEAREIEKFLRYKPSHFRKVCDGWDMRRKLQVDFANGDENNAGEGIFVISCGQERDSPARVSRYTRSLSGAEHGGDKEIAAPSSAPARGSLFGRADDVSPSQSGLSTPSLRTIASGRADSGLGMDDAFASAAETVEAWLVTEFSMEAHKSAEITASAADRTLFALVCPFEEPQRAVNPEAQAAVPHTPASQRATGEIPGRRARLLAIGTKSGGVVAWNMRDPSTTTVKPLRIIQTESPEVSCLAVSALYVLHGGSDGLVQAWDPLASTLDPVRTLSARSSGRANRHVIGNNAAAANANFSAVGAIFLDADPTVLRGVLSFGTFLRYWSYSSTGQTSSRKRRSRPSDMHGRTGSRRQGGTVMGYIAAEEAELRDEQRQHFREQTRLRNRFGVGLGDLTEEEAIRYAEMISAETFLTDEQRRQSASDTADTTSSAGSSSLETVTPDPSLSGFSPPAGPLSSTMAAPQDDTDDDYELQIQQALRLSLLEGVNGEGQSPRDNSSGDYEFSVKYRAKKDKGKRSASQSPSPGQSYTPLVHQPGLSTAVSAGAGVNPDDDFQLALRLSLEEEQERLAHRVGLGIQDQEFPGLETRERVKGKGKGKER